MQTITKTAVKEPIKTAISTNNAIMITGLEGKKTLKGQISIHGAKNAALKAMAASLLFDGPVELKNIPDTEDIQTLSKILSKMGVRIDRKGKDVFAIDSSGAISTDIDAELAKIMRASVVLTGPMLGRFGKVSFPTPGGCVIGARPIDLFISGYRKMGADVCEESGLYKISGSISGCEIFFDKISVGGTETLMMAAVLAKGTTILKNCAMEPEIANVAEWLNECGASIKGIGTPTLVIEGRNGKLLSAKAAYVAIPDRIETASYLLLGALCASELKLVNSEPNHIESVITLLQKSGVPVTYDSNSISISGNTKSNSDFDSFDFITHEYPGVSTDIQAPLVVFLTQSKGKSKVFETIFEGRFKYVDELVRMGANITPINEREVMIEGSAELTELPEGEVLTAHDIRAGFAIVMAALVGKGKFAIVNTHLIDRGYERIVEILQSLGADIRRVSS